MAALNDLTRSLTSTLELKPLLNHITQGAVEILDCEAGSLLLIDESTSEPVFEVVIGPVASDLIGTRLPPGAGLVGKAIENKRGLIRNDVRSSADWFNADDSTGFSSKDMLVVPLVIQELAIGVLEVLNKVDGSPFNQSDLELLTAFAGQMAVAIENARLYTQTDQALASRLNELSIMQQIDKELNATLDIHQVMSITLAAAMRYSESSAGLIGTLEPDGLKIIAKDGFPIDHLGMGEIAGISKLPGIDQVICESSTGSANRPHSQYGDNIVYLQDEKDLKDKSELLSTLPGQTDQILVRIKIDQDIKGIIFLVSTKPSGFSTDNLDFLNRLSDHSAIAVSNAQLYARVRAANEAKSEFVSAAAHELKNPLTSIKGYSDLLVAGSVGPVSEKQAEFLSTIRANAERMRTLVSDLQDISRIEADQLLLQIEEQCLPDLIQEVVASIETQITVKHQQLLVVVPENPDLVRCDNTRTIQILTNLVSNANKYSPQGSKIEIRVDPMIVSEDSDVDQKMMKISVIDNGFGIGEDDQKLIFEQFFRSEDSHVRESTGTGLGLSITKKLVELQGGEIWFESELGKGTSFYFTLPTAIHTGN
jgi:signal transduction histidine kinase